MLTDFKGKNWISKTPAEFVRKLTVRNKGNIHPDVQETKLLSKAIFNEKPLERLEFHFNSILFSPVLSYFQYHAAQSQYQFTLVFRYSFELLHLLETKLQRTVSLIFSQSWKVENCFLKVNPGYKIQTNFVLAVASKQANPGIPVTSGLSSILLIT